MYAVALSTSAVLLCIMLAPFVYQLRTTIMQAACTAANMECIPPLVSKLLFNLIAAAAPTTAATRPEPCLYDLPDVVESPLQVVGHIIDTVMLPPLKNLPI
jgi:hypothetical protein